MENLTCRALFVLLLTSLLNVSGATTARASSTDGFRDSGAVVTCAGHLGDAFTATPPPPPPLTDDQVTKALAGLPGWHVKNGELTAAYQAKRTNIPPFYAQVAVVEDQADHHARITVFYDKITFAMNTGDSGGAITERDIFLAKRISSIAAQHKATISD